YSGAVFDPADALSDPACDPGNYSSQCDLPLEWVQECTPDDGACPDFDEGLLDGMPEVCESVVDGTERYQVCHIDQSAIDAALDTAGDVPCGLLLGAGAPDPNAPHCSRNERLPFERCGGYVWNIYENLGGTLSSTPRTVISPIPLDSNGADTAPGAGGRLGSFGSSRHAIQDIDGDGFLDALTMDLIDDPSNRDLWYVFRGDGEGNFLPRSDGEPYTWQVPRGASPSLSASWFEESPPGTNTGTGKVSGRAGLMDANGDGLPDLLLRPNEEIPSVHAFLNTGARFRAGFMGTHFGQPEWLEHLTYAEAPDVERVGFQISSGTRTNLAQPLDFDGDGRLDYYILHGLLHAGSGAGHLMSMASGADVWPQEIEVQGGEFRVLQDHLDLDGDGLSDNVRVGASAFEMRSDDVDGQPMRLLRHIDNGAGGLIDIRYEAAS